MIDVEKTLSLRGYDPLMLSRWSDKKVWSVCNGCGNGRWSIFSSYRDLCGSCSSKKRASDPEWRKVKSDQMKKTCNDPEWQKRQSGALKRYYIENPEVRDIIAKTLIQWNKGHPEAGEAHSEWMKQHFIDNPEIGKDHSDFMIDWFSKPENRKKMSEARLNSNAAQELYDMMRGGNDIVKHHFIYDHSNPKNHTIEITRSQHSAHHQWMIRAGLEVTHINVTEENKDIFIGRKSYG